MSVGSGAKAKRNVCRPGSDQNLDAEGNRRKKADIRYIREINKINFIDFAGS